jgi:hypothetical protein
VLIPLKEGIGGESRGDRGETEGDFTNNSINDKRIFSKNCDGCFVSCDKCCVVIKMCYWYSSIISPVIIPSYLTGVKFIWDQFWYRTLALNLFKKILKPCFFNCQLFYEKCWFFCVYSCLELSVTWFRICFLEIGIGSFFNFENFKEAESNNCTASVLTNKTPKNL